MNIFSIKIIDILFLSNPFAKRVVAVSLFLCLLSPFLGTYISLQNQKRAVKKQVKNYLIAGLDKSELIHFTFSKDDSQSKLNWHHSREFEFNEQMYDIVESKDLGDSIYYMCWWDKAETLLNKELDNLLSIALNKDPMTKTASQKLLNFTKNLYVNQIQDLNFDFNFSEKIETIIYLLNCFSIHISPLVPPPKQV